jgi:hypothetical protein
MRDYNSAESKRAPKKAPVLYISKDSLCLLNFRFFELHMLAHNGIIFTEGHFFRGITRVFLCDIEKASVSRAEQFDFNSGWLRHNPFLL